MEGHVKVIIQHNKTLLMKNIIPCKELMERLAEQNVFPESTLHEIKDCEPQQKVSSMLEYIAFRGGQVAVKFCDALQMSGHNFVSDFLREEISAIQPNEKANDYSDVIRRFPKLEKIVPDKEKEDLAVYLNEKVKEQALRQMWRGAAKEKEKALDAKQKQLEEAWKYKEIIQEKEEEIQELTKLIGNLNKESSDKSQALKELNDYMDETKYKHKNQMQTQMQYNVANDKSLSRLTERQLDMQNLINETNSKLQDLLLKRGYISNSIRDSDIVSLTNSQGDSIRQHIQDIDKVLDEMDEMKKYVKELEEEKHYVLFQIHGSKHNSKVKRSLVESFRDFTVNKEETITSLKHEIDSLKAALKDQDLKEYSMETVANLQNTIEDMKGSLKNSETRIGQLEQENMGLKAKITELESGRLKDKIDEAESNKNINSSQQVVKAPTAPWANASETDSSAVGSPDRPMNKHIEEPPGVLQYIDHRQSNNSNIFGQTHNLIQPVRASPAFRMKVEQKPIYALAKGGDQQLSLPLLARDVDGNPRRVPSLTGGGANKPQPVLEPPKLPLGIKPQKAQSPRKPNQRPPLLRQDSKTRIQATQPIGSSLDSPLMSLKRMGTLHK